MSRNILILFEAPFFREETIWYAIELAERMDAGLVFLILFRPESSSTSKGEANLQHKIDIKSMETFKPYIRAIKQKNVPFRMENRSGEPSSELFKFLAQSSSFQTIIWGGSEDIMSGKTPKSNPHWLDRLKNVLDCPIVIPSTKHG